MAEFLGARSPLCMARVCCGGVQRAAKQRRRVAEQRIAFSPNPCSDTFYKEQVCGGQILDALLVRGAQLLDDRRRFVTGIPKQAHEINITPPRLPSEQKAMRDKVRAAGGVCTDGRHRWRGRHLAL